MRVVSLSALPARCCAVVSLLALTVCGAFAPPTAAAQWTTSDGAAAFSAYNSAFLFSPSANNDDYRQMQGSTTTSGFWVGAEEIELAVDAYNQNPTAANQTVINQLCNGFIAQFSADWSGDTFDDDLMWATIAFTRSSKATGNPAWLADAQRNFETVWSRGYDSTFGGGIWWDVSAAHTASGFKNSAANWPFVIAGNLLYQATGNTTYQNEAATVFQWASKTLYVAATGEIYDGINESGLQTGQYSYNYGVAIGADTFEKQPGAANNVAQYLVHNLSGGAVNGVNILPIPSQGGNDGSGFNSIALRWVGYAWTHGTLTDPAILSWAQTNVGLAWAERNAQGLSWNNWFASTPPDGLYSWDCANSLAGLLDIPVPATGTSGFTLQAASPVLQLTAGASGSTTIHVTGGSGFSGTVALSATVIGAPAGVTASLGKTTVSGGGSVSLNVDTTAAAQGGNSLVAVTGRSGAVAQTVYVRVGLPFFTVSVPPQTVALQQDQLVSVPVTVTPQNGFTGNVHFAVTSSVPYGVLSWFVPQAGATATSLKIAALDSTFTTAGTPVTVSATGGNYAATASTTLEVSAAANQAGGGTAVDLSHAYNLTGIYPTGASYTGGGLDGQGYAFAAELLDSARVLDGTRFRFGPVSAPDAVYGTGQTLALPPGRYGALELLGTGLEGEQSAQPIVVTYADGSTARFAQSFSDWFSPSLNPNEVEAVAMPYRLSSNGSQQAAQFNVYGYTLPLDASKAVKSLTLPANRNVVLLAATLTTLMPDTPVDLAAAANVPGITSDGASFSPSGGLDGGGTAYSANLLNDTPGAGHILVNGDAFTLLPPGGNNVVYGTGGAIALPSGRFGVLHLLGTGVDGSQSGQTVTVRYTDGTVTTFSQGFSDWFGPQHFPQEDRGVQMAYRNNANGSTGNGPLNLYEYSLPLDASKTVSTLMLPSNRNVLVVAATLGQNPSGK